MVDGGCYFSAENLFVPIEYGEEKQICSPEIPVEHLSETMSVVLDDIQYYLVRVELCYAIFEDGDNYVLYPYWLLFVETKQNCSGEIIRSASTYNIYTYDGYMGEMIVSVENPLK